MKDFLNQEIRVGDLIIYPVRHSANMYLRKARVESVGEVSKSLVVTVESQRWVEGRGFITVWHTTKFRTPDRCVVVKNAE